MATAARKFETEPAMHGQTGLEVTVNHIQEDVTGLKADLKRLDMKIDAVGSSLVEHRLETSKAFGKFREEFTASIAALRCEMKDSIAALRGETTESISKVRGEIAELRNDMTVAIGALRGEIAALRIEMKDAFAKSRSSVITHLAWMVSTMIAATSVAFTVAKYFSGP
jgi:predicted  nucleic acid-binding Zn-ribbon protein